MRLCQIEIENFKGISSKQTIELKPITLLFGANSAGKSTILHALHYMREVIERKNLDPDQTISGGGIDLGGFKTLVHKHELNRPIRIKLRLDISEDQGNEHLQINSGEYFGNDRFAGLEMRYLIGDNYELKENSLVKSIGVGVEVKWSNLLNRPIVSKLEIEMDEAPICSLVSDGQPGQAQLTNFNFNHQQLRHIRFAEAEADADDYEVFSPLIKVITDWSREHAWERIDEKEISEENIRIAVKTNDGAMPEIMERLQVDTTEDVVENLRNVYKNAVPKQTEDEEYQQRFLELKEDFLRGPQNILRQISAMTDFLDEITLGPVRIIREYLKELTYIGPLREIPGRNFLPRLSPDESRWGKGLAAWDLLYSGVDADLLEKVAEWISSEEKLRTGYSLEKSEFKQIPTDSPINQAFERGISEDDLDYIQDLYMSLKTEINIRLRDLKQNLLVDISDVGVGISQIIPVIVACLMKAKGLISVEQPELHIHPAIQVELADLFIQATFNDEHSLTTPRSLLIETHSEHIILRLLRRIEETSDGSIPPGKLPLSNTDVSVIFIDTETNSFKNIAIGKDGEFEDRWPGGFFTERSKELFS